MGTLVPQREATVDFWRIVLERTDTSLINGYSNIHHSSIGVFFFLF
jgi:hypothetical protein